MPILPTIVLLALQVPSRVPFPDITIDTPTTPVLTIAREGDLVESRGGRPWVQRQVARTNGGDRLRVFGGEGWLLDPEAGLVSRVALATGAVQELDLGPQSHPQDVLVVEGTAYVTRRHEPRLLRISLADGSVEESVDLSPLALPGESLALGTMERDHGRLLVQLKLTDGIPDPHPDRGALAVIDLATGTLLDADPERDGIQGIELGGAPPHLRMQVLEEERALYVSSTDGLNDGRGGIERVDLEQLRSTGFVLGEDVIGDLGGFVMTSPEGGYFVFHTDLLPSTHLLPFSVAEGPAPGPEMIVFFEVIDVLVHDPVNHRIYLPGGHASGALLAFDTRRNRPFGRLAAGRPVFDVVLR